MEKRKLLSAAVLSALSALPLAARGVSLSADGRGDALIFPYYTVRNGFETYVSIVNDSPDTKAVKVRFVEGMVGAQVFDITLYMPPRDMWTAAIIESGGGARLVSTDTSCSVPDLSVASSFANYYYNGNVGGISADAGPKGLDRTREGMIEVFDMGVVPDQATSGLGVSVALAAKHDSRGVPANCATLRNFHSSAGYTLNLTDQLNAPSGGLSGTGYLVNSSVGLEFGYDAVALVDFARGATKGIWFGPGDDRPNFDHATPRESKVFASTIGADGKSGPYTLYTDTWNTGSQAVSALFMATDLTNDIVLEKSTASQTDWVVTFPTKRAFVIGANGSTLLSAVPPFQRPFTAAAMGSSIGSACDDFSFAPYNRSGAPAPSGCSSIVFGGFSCIQPHAMICWQTNVISPVPNGQDRQQPGLLGSAYRARGHVTSYTGGTYRFLGSEPPTIEMPAGFDNGWARIKLHDPSFIAPIVTRAIYGSSNRFHGLPMIGFMLQTFTRNGLVVNGVPSTSGFGGNFTHRYERRIVPN
jgi:hypothetical protein